jgi:hypothetical protein
MFVSTFAVARNCCNGMERAWLTAKPCKGSIGRSCGPCSQTLFVTVAVAQYQCGRDNTKQQQSLLRLRRQVGIFKLASPALPIPTCLTNEDVVAGPLLFVVMPFSYGVNTTLTTRSQPRRILASAHPQPKPD